MKKRVVILLLFAIQGLDSCSMVRWPPPLWRKDPTSSTSLFRYVEGDRIGFIAADGRVEIPAQFDNSSWESNDDFSDGMVRVERNGHVSYIDDKGVDQPVSAFGRQLWTFSEGLVEYYERTKINGNFRHLHGYLDRTGAAVIVARFGETKPFSEGLAAVREESPNFMLGRTGYIDKMGLWMIPAKFAMGGQFRDGLAVVVEDGQCQYGLGWLTAAPAVPDRTSCGNNLKIKARCKFGVIEKSGAFVVTPQYDFIRDYSDGLAAFRMDGRWGYLDRRGGIAIKAQFDEASPFSEGIAAVKSDGKWGYIARSGEWLVQPVYRAAGAFSDNRAPVMTNSMWGFIDKTGAVVIPFRFPEATPFAKGLAHVRVTKNEYEWIRPDGLSVFRYTDKRRSIPDTAPTTGR